MAELEVPKSMAQKEAEELMGKGSGSGADCNGPSLLDQRLLLNARSTLDG
ncbi:hypothetical protein ACVBEH_13315 [Roseateles sp. GG27B]